jgi:hypothetical protein
MEKFSSQNPEDNEREKMPPPSEEAAERIARQEEMARLNKPDGEKDPFARAKKYVRVLLAGAVLTFGGKLAHEKYEAHTEEKGATEYVLRSGLKERAEAAGFDLKIDVPNGDGPYIAHIGYIHSFNADTPSAQLLNELAHELILEGNKDAEKLLLSLKEKAFWNW